MLRIGVLAVSLAAVSAIAQESPPRVADLVARNSYAFELSATTLRGAGADFLRRQTAGTQFVLLGEDHMDHATPLFAGALFRMLHDTHG
jgi:erythromycin esterase-like protein